MRRITAIFCTFALAGCGGSSTLVPNGASQSSGSGALAPRGSNVTYETETLYAGSQKTIAMYLARTSGFPSPLRTVSLGAANGSATSVATDGTIYETVNGTDLNIFAPDANGAAQPEQHITNAGSVVALVGDGIDTVSRTATSYTVKTLPYAGGDHPVPIRTITGTGRGGPAFLASDYNSNVYVAHDAQITVFRAEARGRAVPIRQINGVSPNVFDITVGKDGTIYLASNGSLGGESVISEWEPGNAGSTPTRRLGPFRWADFGRMTAVTIDGNGWLFVGFQRQDGPPDVAGNPTPGTNYVNVYGQAVAGAATPLRTINNVVAAGEVFRSLAIGPLLPGFGTR